MDDDPEVTATVRRLNHAVLRVTDVARAVEFYRAVLGMEIVDVLGDGAAFLRVAGGDNHHDLGLMATTVAGRPGAVGLYHLAWQVDTLPDLVAVGDRLRARSALRGASDHGATKSIYGVDPDGNELEIMWLVPPSAWGEHRDRAVVEPLDLDAELARWGDTATAG